MRSKEGEEGARKGSVKGRSRVTAGQRTRLSARKKKVPQNKNKIKENYVRQK